MSLNKAFWLPYQQRYLQDTSRIKIVEKSRRIGFTYVESYEDVEYAAIKPGNKVYFSSADESAGKEYIDYCRYFCGKLNIAAQFIGEELLDVKKDITAMSVHFKSGSKIHALTSNPRRFRSKGGKVVLDEFAFHDSQDELWRAARPTITWGFPLRIISTYNGKNNKYYRLVEDVKRGKLPWSLHSVPITLAVAEGLADKIAGRKLTEEERLKWLKEEHANCGDEITWMQEYMCEPVDEATAFITYDLIGACEQNDLLLSLDDLMRTQFPEGLFFGVDVGRKKDLFSVWATAKTGPVKTTVFRKDLERRPFKEMKELLWTLYRHKDFRRACQDSTGLGIQLAEEAQDDFGKYRVEAVTFTPAVKEDLAYTMLRTMEDRQFFIPADPHVREDLHSIRKIVTTAGNVRFDVGQSDTNGHADRFWAAALSLHAAKDDTGPMIIKSKGRRKMTKQTAGYF